MGPDDESGTLVVWSPAAGVAAASIGLTLDLWREAGGSLREVGLRGARSLPRGSGEGPVGLLAPLGVTAEGAAARLRARACKLPEEVPLGFYEELPAAARATAEALAEAARAAGRRAGRELVGVIVREPRRMAERLRAMAAGGVPGGIPWESLVDQANRYWRGERLWLDERLADRLGGPLGDELVWDAPHERSEALLERLRGGLRGLSADALEARVEGLEDPEAREAMRALGRVARRGSARDFAQCYLALELGEAP